MPAINSLRQLSSRLSGSVLDWIHGADPRTPSIERLGLKRDLAVKLVDYKAMDEIGALWKATRQFQVALTEAECLRLAQAEAEAAASRQ